MANKSYGQFRKGSRKGARGDKKHARKRKYQIAKKYRITTSTRN